MIQVCREAQAAHEGEFAQGLAGWLRGDEDNDAEAAGLILAETILMHRTWLRAHVQKG